MTDRCDSVCVRDKIEREKGGGDRERTMRKNERKEETQ